MNIKQIKITLVKEKPLLQKKFHVKTIGVFGSYAREEQTSKSDIDILVSFSKPKFDSYMNLKFLLEKRFKRKVDLVMEKTLKPGLEFVKKEAKYAEL